MTPDIIIYLSGHLPLGIYLIPLAGGSFSLAWWFVWLSAKFWDRAFFYRILGRGWMVIFTAYLVLWLLNRPDPIPIRVIVAELQQASENDNNWRTRGVADVIESRLAASDKPFVALSGGIIPALENASVSVGKIDSLAHRMNVRWIAIVTRKTTDSDELTVNVEIRRRKGGVYSPMDKMTLPHMSFSRGSRWLADEVAVKMGDLSLKNGWNDPPVDLPDGAFDTLYHAIYLRQTNQIDSAITLLEKLTGSHPAWTRPFQEIAATYLKNTPGLHLEEIHNSLMSALEIDGSSSVSYTLSGGYFIEFRDWEEAESALKLAINFNPDNPQAYFYLSRLSEVRISDLPWSSKAALLRRTLHLAPGYEAAQLALSMWHTDRFEKWKAFEILEEGLRINPTSIPLLQSSSALEIETGLYEKATVHCRRILAEQPKHAGALYNLGIALIWLENYDEAIRVLNESYANGGTVNNIYYLGVAYQRKKDWNEAIKHFERRITLPQSTTDRVVISARERIKMLQRWIAETDTVKETPE